MSNKKISSLFILSASLILSSCSKDDGPSIPPYTVPDTYNFDNADFTDATKSVNMWLGFTGYLGRSTARQLSQDTVNYLWNNSNSAFTSEFIVNLPYTAEQLNGFTGVKLSALTTEPNVIKAFADSMVVVSQYYNTPGSEGIAGKQGSRLFNYSGLEFNQAVAKGLMGSFVMKKIFEHLDKAVVADNNTVTPGKGTAMQHEWDKAFGYVGIPTDYDPNKSYTSGDATRPLAVGGYFGERGKYINAGSTTFEAFRKGRAAIAVKDYVVRDAAIATIKEYVEKTIAAALYYYITSPQGKSSDRVAQMHELSEGYGFVAALKHRSSGSKLSPANYQKLVDILSTNFYTLIGDANFTKLKEAQVVLTSAYGQLQP